MADLRTTIRVEKSKPCRFRGLRFGGVYWSPSQKKEAETILENAKTTETRELEQSLEDRRKKFK